MSDEIRDGIMALNTRQFGRAIEVLIKLIYSHEESESSAYDLKGENLRVEVKASRVLESSKLDINEGNLYDLITGNTDRERLIKHSDRDNYDFDCNIQQIKVVCFDVLYYVLLFSDVVEVFKITPEQIESDRDIFFSDKQHRGNEGEGQFHINNKTYEHHKDNYFEKRFSYEDIKDILLEHKNEDK